MKILCLFILVMSASCTTNKALRNAKIKDLGPTSISSINLGSFQSLK
ncbi:hypothetical protein [Halobacteriovorax sp. JY17]|nr:hypothetical protein [Halobacteriovorax sp. JY17]